MKQFTKILNNIAKNDIKFQKALAASPSPCCAAFNKLSKPINLISRIKNMLENVRGSQNAAKLFSNDYKKFILDELIYFAEKYCECTKPPPSSYPLLPPPDTGAAIVETYSRPLYNQIDVISLMHPIDVQEKACAIAIEEILKDKRFDSTDLFNNFLPNGAAGQRDIRNFSNDLREVLIWINLDTNLYHLFDKSSPLDFIKSLCRLKRHQPNLYTTYLRDLRYRINSEFIGLWFETTPSVFENMLFSSEISEAPQVSGAMCLPVVDPETEASLNQYGIGAGVLAACVIGAGFFGGAVGIRAYCRMNKAGKAAAIATCAAAAASQTGSAAVNANNPAVRSLINNYLDKLCEQDGEGGLFECEESTQGGGDGGGGPVDPPGGGEVGEMGGGIL